jgi:hypothetical protein
MTDLPQKSTAAPDIVEASDRDNESGEGSEEKKERIQKEHNDKAMLRVTLASTLVAVIAALGALWSGYEARETRTEDERPFLAVDISPEQIASDDPNGKLLRLKSLGKTAALKVKVRCLTVPSTGAVDWARLETADDQQKRIWEYTDSFPYILPASNEPISCSQIVLPAGTLIDQKYFTVFGTVSYESIGEDKYQTPFCLNLNKYPDNVVHSIEPALTQCTDIAAKLPPLK